MINYCNRLALFLDIAGQIAQSATNYSSYTVAAVAMSANEANNVRELLNAQPPKWAQTNNTAAVKMTELVLKSSVAACVLRVRKKQPIWDQFWKDAAAFHQKMATVKKARVGFVKASNVIRYAAFGDCCASLLGTYMKFRGLPLVIGPNGLTPLELDVTCDSDIQGQENIDMFKELLRFLTSRLHVESSGYQIRIDLS